MTDSTLLGSGGLQPVLTALLTEQGGVLQVRAPAVGSWRDAPAAGALVTPGSDIGALEILGVIHRLRAPQGALGVVAWPDSARAEEDMRLARRPVQYGQVLLYLHPEGVASMTRAVEEDAGAQAVTEGDLAFSAPMSGRFYCRPAPDKPPFVAPGDIVQVGSTVGLLEVMKTFNRVTYGADNLPGRARVKAVVPADDSDVSAGDVILLIEADILDDG